MNNRNVSGSSIRKPAISYGGPLKRSANDPTILAHALEQAATTGKGLVYIHSDHSETFQSYEDLLLDARKILHGLRKLGLQPQDKVVFQIESTHDFISAFWGCVLGGFVPVPVTHIAYTHEQVNRTVGKLRHTLQMLDHPLLLIDAHFASEISHSPELLELEKFPVATVDGLRHEQPDYDRYDSQPDETAVMMLTSGSTGIPKGVLLSHRNLLSHSMASAQMNGFSREDINLNWIPIDHVAGLIYFHMRAVYLGQQEIHFPFDLFLQDPLIWLDLIERFRVTIAFGPNFAYGLINDRAEMIEQRRWDLSSMKFFLNGAETIVAKTARRFLQLLAPHRLAPTTLYPSWGMAEVSSGVTFSDNFSLDTSTDDDLFVEVGAPIPGVYLRIVDNQNQLIEDGETGHLQAKGSTVMSGYYRNPRANQDAFTEDGWFDTGDSGFLREGRLTITGRHKDIIIVCGNNYYCHDIEAAVEEIEGIDVSYTAACAIRESGSHTDRLAIFFSAGDADDKQWLMNQIKETVVQKIGLSPDYLIPVGKDSIPKTAIGKIQRQQLKERFESGEFDSRAHHLGP
uniref:Polyketide synthase PksJ n=1 Tax=Candidatus Kentrum sp. FW TaxID=2126338 RepID=A0A450RYI2_9GAMM|nr:MAG: polyketide synthase PksJ [Candidatus Kentron sp. FW]